MITRLNNPRIPRLLTLFDTKGTEETDDDIVIARGWFINNSYDGSESAVILDLYSGKEVMVDYSPETISVCVERADEEMTRQLINVINIAKGDKRLSVDEKKSVVYCAKPSVKYPEILITKLLELKEGIINMMNGPFTGIEEGYEEEVQRRFLEILDKEHKARIQDVDELISKEKDEGLIESYKTIKDDLNANVSEFKIMINNRVKPISAYEISSLWPSLLNPSPFAM